MTQKAFNKYFDQFYPNTFNKYSHQTKSYSTYMGPISLKRCRFRHIYWDDYITLAITTSPERKLMKSSDKTQVPKVLQFCGTCITT